MYTTPNPEIIQQFRLKDGPNYIVPQEYLNNLVIDDLNTIHFPIYTLDGTQVGWNSRTLNQKMWSQSILQDVTPRYTAWTNTILDIIYSSRKICICEGPFDALALAPLLPWTISANTSRVQQEILELCKMWKLDVTLALDQDVINPKTGKATGQDATQRIKYDLEQAMCKVHTLSWANTLPYNHPGFGIHLKDPSQALAVLGPLFYSNINLQLNRVLRT